MHHAHFEIPDQQRHDHVETLLAIQFARFYVQMLELAAICLASTMVLAIIVVIALRA
jgi:hypothetical protein